MAENTANEATDAAAEGIQWVEIIEPKTQQRMFANMVTGECLWDAPLDNAYKKMDSNQWWELYDVMTERFYYYNAQTGDTIWNRPVNADIIPLSKLQSTSSNGDEDDDAFMPENQRILQSVEREISPSYSREYSQEPFSLSPKETSINGMDQTHVQESRSSSHSPDGVGTTKTSTLRSKLEGELFQNRGKSLSHSPTHSLVDARRRTASSNQLPSESKDDPPQFIQPQNIPVAPAFTPPISRAAAKQEEKKTKRHSSFSGEDSPKPTASGAARRKTEDGLQAPDLHKFGHLSQHTKGIIIKRKVSIANMLQWTKDPIKQPMIMTRDKAIKKECCELFKLVQSFMTDRKAKERDENKLALEIMTRAWEKKPLRDELFIQLCKQTTANVKTKSIVRGWQLFTIALAFFPPSIKFRSYLEGYLWRHVEPSSDSHKVPVHVYAEYCHKRVEKMTMMGAKKGLKKPSLDEIQHAKDAPFNPSMFGTTIEEVMEMQEDTKPHLKIPWVVVLLTETVLRLNGPHTEGIFRVPGDIDEVNALKLHVDKWRDPPVSLTDPHVPASLLKLWFRELEDPLIPENYYQDCIDNSDHQTNALALVDSLPDLNKRILLYLVHFLQKFTAETSSSVTKMGIENLAMVWAPNFLRCPSDDHTMIFNNTRKEMSFLRILLRRLDTTEVDDQQSPA